MSWKAVHGSVSHTYTECGLTDFLGQPAKMQTQNMEVGDFSNANTKCSSPEVMKE